MATIVVCNECGRALKNDTVVIEMRVKGFMRNDVVDQIDTCQSCSDEVRLRFLASPGLDRILSRDDEPRELERRRRE